MISRKKIAILYDYNENWIASTYYIQNLISSLNNIPESHKPNILVLAKSKQHYEKLVNVTGYPFLEFRKITIWERIANNFIPAIFLPGFICRKIWKIYRNIDLIFPATHGISFSVCKNKLFWVADFQEHYLPEFFSAKEIRKRKAIQQKIVQRGQNIILSSKSAKNDFDKIYPDNQLKKFVLPFAVTHLKLSEVNQESIRQKYAIPHEYFICSNQFWKHKNHSVVLRALAYLKKQEKIFVVVFTGKKHDYRNPHYFDEITQLAEELGIQDNVIFPGFISREDQLFLMKNAIAVIQPSLFEGWSTVVEDAKALKTKIIVSSIAVHHEQLALYPGKYFFDPANVPELSKSMEIASASKEEITYDYHKDILNYGKGFSGIMDMILQTN